MRAAVAVAALIAMTAPALAENCWFKWSWEQKAACECQKLGYRQGSQDFLQCVAISLDATNQNLNRMNQMWLQMQRQQQPPPQTNCATRNYGGIWYTNCW